MAPFVVGKPEDRVDAVPRCTARWLRQDDVLAVLRGCVDELLRIHPRKTERPTSDQLLLRSLASLTKGSHDRPLVNALMFDRAAK